jgi:hypothetical protein
MKYRQRFRISRNTHYSNIVIPGRAQRGEGEPAASADTRAKMNNETALKYHLRLAAWFPFPRREGAARRG